jgi:hypothetical protein
MMLSFADPRRLTPHSADIHRNASAPARMADDIAGISGEPVIFAPVRDLSANVRALDDIGKTSFAIPFT